MSIKKSLIIAALVAFIFPAIAGASTLHWTASEGGPQGYVVYYGLGESPEIIDRDSPKTGIYHVPVNQLQVEDIENVFGIPPGAVVWFAISAWNDRGESLPCPAVEYRKIYEPRPQRLIDLGMDWQSGAMPETPKDVKTEK